MAKIGTDHWYVRTWREPAKPPTRKPEPIPNQIRMEYPNSHLHWRAKMARGLAAGYRWRHTTIINCANVIRFMLLVYHDAVDGGCPLQRCDTIRQELNHDHWCALANDQGTCTWHVSTDEQGTQNRRRYKQIVDTTWNVCTPFSLTSPRPAWSFGTAGSPESKM